MTLDEAIRHCEEVTDNCAVTECEMQHRQLAGWLKELKAYKEQSGDAISRQASIDAINSHFGFNIEEEYGSAVQEVINGLPSAQPERKKGKWRHYEGYLTCSECGTEYDDDIMTHCGDDVPKFCPNCGADMRGKQDEY